MTHQQTNGFCVVFIPGFIRLSRLRRQMFSIIKLIPFIERCVVCVRFYSGKNPLNLSGFSFCLLHPDE